MEVIFPTAAGYAGFFMVGFRKTANGVTQRTGTVILKRTYAVDPIAETLMPSAAALPVFMQDQADNLVSNSDFELGEVNSPSDWEPEAATIALATGQGVASSKALQVSGSANGWVIQTLTFEKPLGGRQFTFSFSARANHLPARIENVQLEAGGSTPICVINADLTVAMTRFSATGMWPANLNATEMQVVLRMATDPSQIVFYDQVQIEERSYLTLWDPKTVLRYEHDLAAFKPQGDVMVLGFTSIVGVSRVQVNGTTWLERNVLTGGVREKAMFGWESRTGSLRKEEAGTYPDDPNAYPLSDPLPADFSNRFFNGYQRSALQLAALPYLPAAAQILIEREADSDYCFGLRGDRASAAYYYYNGSGPDEEGNWQSRDVEVNLDTLVIEPEANRCYAVWRGVWPFDLHPDGAYRRLVVTGTT